MASVEEARQVVVELLGKRHPPARVAALAGPTNLIAAGFVDSFGFLELVAEVEARLGIQLDLGAHDFEVVATLGGLCDAFATAG